MQEPSQPAAGDTDPLPTAPGAPWASSGTPPSRPGRPPLPHRPRRRQTKRARLLLWSASGAGALALLVVLASLAVRFLPAQPRAPSTPIIQENTLPGTADWKITQGSKQGEIQAYAGEESINRGGVVHLYVSTTAPTYSVQVFRLGYYGGAGGRLLATYANLPGRSQGYYPNINIEQRKVPAPLNCPTCIISLKDSRGTETDLNDANWQLSQTIPFSTTWISGIYVLKLTEHAHGTQWDVPLVVRDDAAQAAILYQDPLNTDQAYNLWGGADAYMDYRRGSRWGYELSYNRPYSQDYGAGHLFYWTYPMVRFLEQRGYDVRYSTNTAVAEGLTNLGHYRLFLSAGHDEYWSAAERQKLEAAMTNGINVAFFGANDLYWQIRTTADSHQQPDRIIITYKDLKPPYLDPEHGTVLDTVRWRDPAVHDPEDRLLKAMYGFDPMTGEGTKNSMLQDMVVTNTSSWVFAGTGLKDGATIKDLLGQEVDTLYQDGSLTAADALTIIGQSPYISDGGGEHWTAYAVMDHVAARHQWIFDAGTMFWPEALSSFVSHTVVRPPESAALERLTQNLLDRMTSSS